MPNIDAPTGLRPITNAHGVVPISTWDVSSTDATAIYEGQMVYRLATGFASSSDGTTAVEILHTLGVAAHYVAATPGADAKIAVYDDVNQKYLIQGDDGTINTKAEKINARGMYAVPVNPNAGNTTTLQSKMELDTSALTSVTVASTNGTIFKIVDFVEASNNLYIGTTTNAANAEWIVQIQPVFFLSYEGRTVL